VVAVVAATLRKVSEQQQCEADQRELALVAEQVEGDWDEACCPLCQEVTCDEDCPLWSVRQSLAEQGYDAGAYVLSTRRPGVVGGPS